MYRLIGAAIVRSRRRHPTCELLLIQRRLISTYHQPSCSPTDSPDSIASRPLSQDGICKPTSCPSWRGLPLGSVCLSTAHRQISLFLGCLPAYMFENREGARGQRSDNGYCRPSETLIATLGLSVADLHHLSRQRQCDVLANSHRGTSTSRSII